VTPTTELPPLQQMTGRELLRKRAFGSVFGTLLLSALGWSSLATALAIHVFDITGSKRDLGLLGLSEFIPAVVLVFVSGPIADRFDRRKVVVSGLALEIAALAVLITLDYSKVHSVAPFLALTFVMGIALSAINPSMRSLVPASAPPGQLTKVVAVSSVTWQISAIFGPLLGTFAYRHSPRFAYILAVTLLLSAIVCALSIPRSVGRDHLVDGTRNSHDANEKPTLRSALQGLVTIRQQPILFGAIALDLFAVLFGGAVALLPAVAKELLHGDSTDVGLIRMAGGIGATLVTFGLAARPLRRSIGRTLLIAVAVFGSATILFGLSRSLWVSMAAMFVLNAADSVSVFVRSTLVPLVTPAATRGRVLAVEAVFIGASNELGAFESGETAHHFGTTFSIVSGGLITLVVVAIFWIALPALRNVDRFEDLETN
jgi:MFS family permease